MPADSRLPAPDLSLAALHDDELLLRRGPRKHDLSVVLENVVQLLGGHVLQVASVDHTGLGISRVEMGKEKNGRLSLHQHDAQPRGGVVKLRRPLRERHTARTSPVM